MCSTEHNAKSSPVAVVTGASRGLGKSIAMELSAQGIDTLLVATSSTVQTLCDEIEARYHTRSRCFITDLRFSGNVLDMAADINQKYDVFILVNNVGVGGTCGFLSATPEYLERIIDLNVRCTALLTHALLPNLLRQKKSYVLNVGSMAALTPVGYKTIYPASKSFVRAFSMGLREELRDTSVSVTLCQPGAMATNAEVSARIDRQGRLGRATLKSTEWIAHRCVRQMFRGKREAVINILARLLSAIVPEKVRTRMLTRIVKRELE